MFSTPILFLIFNRLDTTKKVFEEIRKLKPSKLYIAADGPRENNDLDVINCLAVREYVTGRVDWDCEVKTLFRDKNLGCGLAPALAISWFFKNEELGIILEDDCLPHPDFFKFCAEMLLRYHADERIWSINGSNIGYKTKSDYSYGFTRFMNMWGWATWRRSFDLVDYSMKSWVEEPNKLAYIDSIVNEKLWNYDKSWSLYWYNIFESITKHTSDVWDYHWIFAQLKHKRLTIFPYSNLVSNIGFNSNATHTTYEDHFAANLALSPLTFPLKLPQNLKVDLNYERIAVKNNWCYHNDTSLLAEIKKQIIRYSRILKHFFLN